MLSLDVLWNSERYCLHYFNSFKVTSVTRENCSTFLSRMSAPSNARCKTWHYFYPNIYQYWDTSERRAIEIDCSSIPLVIGLALQCSCYTLRTKPQNTIESLNSVICEVIKKRKLFPIYDSAKNVVYLAIMDASKKWSMPIRNWKTALNRLMILFEGRLQDYV